MLQKLDKVGGVILVWVVSNFLGVAVIGGLSLLTPFLKSIPGMIVSSLVIGLPIGFAQWIVLRRITPISILWVLTIPVGLRLALVVSPFIARIWGFLDDESVLAMTAFCTTIGLIVGLIQWLFLQSHFPKSLLWVISSAIGLGLGICLVLVSNLINQSGIISIILVVLVYTTITGLFISWVEALNKNISSNLVSSNSEAQ